MTINRIEQCFAGLKARREKGLVTYITAGDPDLSTTAGLVQAMDRAGADIIELGVPFSDPVADGPVIQRAASRALSGGVTLGKILDLVAGLRQKVAAPLILMGYYNPILQYGLAEFSRDAAAAGVDGVIVPDLPADEAGPLREATGDRIGVVPLVAPVTGDDRLALVSSLARGFIYCITVTGITGTSQDVTRDIADLSRRVRAHSSLPLAAGFGISTPAQAAQVARHYDAVVVGSAIVKLIEAHGADSISAVTDLVRGLKTGLTGL